MRNKSKVTKFRKKLCSTLNNNLQLQALDNKLTQANDPAQIETLCNQISTILTTTVLEISETVRGNVQHSSPWYLMNKNACNDAINCNEQHIGKMHRTKWITIPIPSRVTLSYAGVLQYVKEQVKEAWKTLNKVTRNAFPHRVYFF